MKNLSRLCIVLFSLTMLTAYVIHAERSRGRTAVATERNGATNPANVGQAPAGSNRPPPVVASSSKSIAPLISVPSDVPSSSQVFFPGSKSAPVFSGTPLTPQAARPVTNQLRIDASRVFMPGSKSAPVFSLPNGQPTNRPAQRVQTSK